MKQAVIVAKVISYLFHPLLLPTAGLFLIFSLDDAGLWLPSDDMKGYLYLFVFAVTFLLPFLNALFLLKIKQINSLRMDTRQERSIPYLGAAVFYLAASWFLLNADVPVLIKALLFGATVVVLGVWLVNLFWKISAHMAGMGGLCGMMLAISFRLQIEVLPVLMVLFFLAGLIGFARLRLNAHTPPQVYGGFLMGVLVQLVLFL